MSNSVLNDSFIDTFCAKYSAFDSDKIEAAIPNTNISVSSLFFKIVPSCYGEGAKFSGNSEIMFKCNVLLDLLSISNSFSPSELQESIDNLTAHPENAGSIYGGLLNKGQYSFITVDTSSIYVPQTMDIGYGRAVTELETALQGTPSLNVMNLNLPDSENVIFLSLKHKTVESRRYRFPISSDSFSVSTSANFSSEQILGRSTPYFAYNNSTPRIFTFNFKLIDEICLFYNGIGILQFGDFLTSLTYPTYDKTFLYPPIVEFSLGEMWTNMEAIVPSVDVSYEGPLRDAIPTILSTNLALTELSDNSYSAHNIQAWNNNRGRR